jgi:hypothetical protein
MVEDERSLNRKIGLCLRLTISLDPKPGSIRRLEVITGMERRRLAVHFWAIASSSALGGPVRPSIVVEAHQVFPLSRRGTRSRSACSLAKHCARSFTRRSIACTRSMAVGAL